MEFVAYSDESYSTAKRYRSVAAFSFRGDSQKEIRKELNRILKGSNVSEFKWHHLKDAKYRFCGLKLVEALIGFIGKYDARIDVLIWDTYDSRHQIQWRDDKANFERMFFHLLSQVLKRRPRNAKWKIYPDKRLDIDWDTVAQCLEAVGKRIEVIDLPLLNNFFMNPYYEIQEFAEVESHEHPCCQVADLFAGLAVFSKTHYALFKEWSRKKHLNLSLFKNDDVVISNREKNRFEVLNHLNENCKKNRLGVSLESSRCLCTFNPARPMNFWHYIPQHKQDKAPVKVKEI
jgi:hypothetical protein